MKHLLIGPGAMGFFIYLGYLTKLKDSGRLADLEEISGASAGSLLAFLFLASKGDCSDMLDFALKAPVKQIMKVNLKTLLKHFGLVPHEKLLKIICSISEKYLGKPDVTFRELYAWNPIKLHVSAYCVDLTRTMYFSVDNAPDMSVCQAVTASIAVPFLISTIRIGEWHFIDGGAVEEIPGGAAMGNKREEVFCMKLAYASRYDVKDFKSYAFTILSSIQSMRHMYDVPLKDIPCEDVDIFDFGADSKTKLKMFMYGNSQI
jgi:predicted acylesterase/phospholipase RssA